MKKKLFLYSVIIWGLFSCSNKTDVKFDGISLKTPSNSFIKQIEEKGFKKSDSLCFKGNYLSKEVSISLMKEINNHYRELMLVATFIEEGSDSKQYYKSLCNEIESEHSGFKRENEDNLDVLKTVFYGANGSMITVMHTYEHSLYLGTVVAIYKTELEVEN